MNREIKLQNSCASCGYPQHVGHAPDCQSTEDKKKKKKPEEASSCEEGLQKATQAVQEKLSQKTERPQTVYVYINGPTGAGKSYFSMELEDILKTKGIDAKYIETDLYSTGERYQPEDLFRHQHAWKNGETFSYHNLRLNQDELVTSKPEVIIVGGKNATEEVLGPSDFNIVVLTSIEKRIARRIMRDCITHIYGIPNPEKFLQELNTPAKNNEDDLLIDIESHELPVKNRIKAANLVIHNDFSTNKDPQFSIEGDEVHFKAYHEGKKYDIRQKMDNDRLERLKAILNINQ